MAAESTRRFWTIPNILTLSRLALIPLFLWLMSRPDRRYWVWGGVVIIYGIVSDILDGYLARKLNQITETGKILDPLADKITAGALAVFCVLERGLPIWALGATVIRDLALVAGSRIWWKNRLGSRKAGIKWCARPLQIRFAKYSPGMMSPGLMISEWIMGSMWCGCMIIPAGNTELRL